MVYHRSNHNEIYDTMTYMWMSCSSCGCQAGGQFKNAEAYAKRANDNSLHSSMSTMNCRTPCGRTGISWMVPKSTILRSKLGGGIIITNEPLTKHKERQYKREEPTFCLVYADNRITRSCVVAVLCRVLSHILQPGLHYLQGVCCQCRPQLGYCTDEEHLSSCRPHWCLACR
jgi:hypothetical protein